MSSKTETTHGPCGFGCDVCTGETDCVCIHCHPTAAELRAAHGYCDHDCAHCTGEADCACIECHPAGKIEIEAFVTGNDGTWRLDVSRALDGDSRSSMMPLYELIAQHFDALCSWPDPLHGDSAIMQFGAFRITIEPIEHPRNELYRAQGQTQTHWQR
jgi:hypothetical protein